MIYRDNKPQLIIQIKKYDRHTTEKKIVQETTIRLHNQRQLQGF